MLFLMDKVREDPISGGDLVFHQNNMKAIGEKWRNLSQSEQQVNCSSLFFEISSYVSTVKYIHGLYCITTCKQGFLH